MHGSSMKEAPSVLGTGLGIGDTKPESEGSRLLHLRGGFGNRLGKAPESVDVRNILIKVTAASND